MNILFAAIVLTLVCLLLIWLLPSWDALVAQLGSFFSPAPPAGAGPPGRALQPLRADKRPHADAPPRAHGGKRHSVLPHQARGR